MRTRMKVLALGLMISGGFGPADAAGVKQKDPCTDPGPCGTCDCRLKKWFSNAEPGSVEAFLNGLATVESKASKPKASGSSR